MNWTMELSPAQKHLIHGLKLFGLTEDETVGIVLAMKTPKQQDELMMWMVDNLKATPSEIIGKTMDIVARREFDDGTDNGRETNSAWCKDNRSRPE